jgi:hypothetical protein
MSQIASAYVVTQDILNKLGTIAARHDFKLFWNTLRTEAVAVEPPYEYSGYVVAVAIQFLEEQGIEFQPATDQPELEVFTDEMNLETFVTKTEANKLIASLNSHVFNGLQLKEYFEEFSGEEWDEAGVAMQSAIDFLKSGLNGVRDNDSYLMLFIG